MIEILNSLYEAGKLNNNKCSFPETLIFNEGWMLRIMLKKWRDNDIRSKLPFLPFPDHCSIFSEAQLKTPFNNKPRNEKNTHVDGIVGQFSIRESTKSGIYLQGALGYLALFEAKMYSGLSEGTKHVPDYNQLPRMAACIINELQNINDVGKARIWCVVLYPEDNAKIDKSFESSDFVLEQISRRASEYGINRINERFNRSWKDILKSINIKFVTWEEVLVEINDRKLDKFYENCKIFNRKDKR